MPVASRNTDTSRTGRGGASEDPKPYNDMVQGESENALGVEGVRGVGVRDRVEGYRRDVNGRYLTKMAYR